MAGEPEARAHRFPRRMRVLRRAEFERAMRRGVRGTNQHLTMWVHSNELEHPRLGLIVGRKHGSAVVRNRLKRVMRAAFRLSQHELPAGFDLICTPRLNATLNEPECRAALISLARKLVRRVRRP